jgi:hypothetical protein
MKTPTLLASVLFGAMAAAAPFDKRALVTRTQVVTETVLVYTTVYADEVPVAPATTTPGLFFEKPKSSSAAPSSTSVYTPPAVAPSSAAPAPAPSSTFTPPAPSSAYTPPVAEVPSSTVVPAPQPTIVNTPAPQPTSVYVPPAPVSSVVVAPQPSSAPPTSNPTGEKHEGDITVYDTFGAFGACGTALNDSDMIVALSAEAMGASTYNVMTGEATNPWCGQKITISYNGNQVDATIMDKCPGCKGYDIDCSRGVWKALGINEDTRLQATWSKS